MQNVRALVAAVPAPKFSPLVLADRLITLAQEADRAGYGLSAGRLIGAAYAVLDEENAPAARREDVRKTSSVVAVY